MASSAGERRFHTLMRVDTVGSTVRSSFNDIEEEAELDLRLQDLVLEALDYYGDGNYLAKFSGDGGMITFGFPRQRNTEAILAVQTGLRVIENVARDRDLNGSSSTAMHVRVALHWGEVFVTAGRDGQLDIFGFAPNLVAKVEKSAEPDRVTITPDLYHLVSGFFDVRSQGSKEIESTDFEVELIEVLGPSEATSWLEALAPLHAMVGREEELAAIRERLQLSQSHPQVVILSGDPGVGKSRLAAQVVEELAEEAEGSWCCHKLVGREQEAHQPFGALRRFVEARAEIDAGDEREARTKRITDLCIELELADAVPTLLELVHSGAPAAFDRFGLADRRTSLEHLARFVSVSGGEMLLLSLDDSQWVDPSSLEVVAKVLADPPGRLVLLLTTRPEGLTGVTEAIARVGLSVSTAAEVTKLEIGPLGIEATSELVANTSSGQLSNSVVRSIAKRSAGIPLVAEELALLVVESGDQALTGIPPRVSEQLAARLTAVTESAKDAAFILAALGAGLAPEVFEHLAGGAFVDGCAELHGKGLVRPIAGEPSLYRFAHDLVGEAAYAMRPRRERKAFHRRASEVLLSDAALAGTVPPELFAKQLSGSDLAEHRKQGAETWLKAGHDALAISAYAEAAQRYRLGSEAASSVDDVDPMTTAFLRAGYGASVVATRGFTDSEAQRAYQEAAEQLQLADNRPSEWLAALWGVWAYHLVRAEHRLADKTIRDPSLHVPDPLRVTENRVVQAMDGVGCFFRGEFERASRLLTASSELVPADTAGYPFPQEPGLAGLAFLPVVELMVGRAKAAQRYAERCAADAADYVAQTDGDDGRAHFMQATTEAFLAWFQQLAGNPAEAAGHAREAIAISTERGYDQWLAAGSLHLGIAQAARGELDAGLTVIENVLPGWRMSGSELMVPYFLHGRAQCELGLGQVGEAMSTLDEAIALTRTNGELFFLPALLVSRAEAAGLSRQVVAQQGLLSEACELAAKLGARDMELRSACGLAELTGKAEDVERVEYLRNQIAELDT